MSDRTADRADAFVRRQSMWARLLGLFRTSRPSEEECAAVTVIAEVAIDQVFQALKIPDHVAAEKFTEVKDYAECAALYGYVLGHSRGVMACHAAPAEAD